jgi:hypothetical protein
MSSETHLMRHLSCTVLVVLISLLTVTSSSGKSSKLVNSWKSPTHAAANKPHRVLALGLSDKTVVRAEFEDALAKQLAQIGMEAIPGNTILLRPEDTEFDPDYLKTQIREHKIDAVVVARLIHVENTTTYVPGAPYVPPYPYYSSFYGYYGTVYPMVYSPGYLKEEKRVRIETNLYVITSEEGNLVWTCITDTFNPSNMRKSIDRLVKLVVKQMQSDSVI